MFFVSVVAVGIWTYWYNYGSCWGRNTFPGQQEEDWFSPANSE